MSDAILTPVHLHILAGDAYAVQFSGATAVNANVRVAVGIFANNIAKSIFIYRAICNNNDTAEADVTITHDTALDTHITNVLTPVNMQIGSSATSLATVKSTPNANQAPTIATGTNRAIYRLTSSQLGLELFKNGSGILIPAGTANAAAEFWVKVPTAGKVGILLIEYIEF